MPRLPKIELSGETVQARLVSHAMLQIELAATAGASPTTVRIVIARVLRDSNLAPIGVKARTFSMCFSQYRKNLRPRRHDRDAVQAFAETTLANWRTRESFTFVSKARVRIVALHFGVKDDAGGGET